MEQFVVRVPDSTMLNLEDLPEDELIGYFSSFAEIELYVQTHIAKTKEELAKKLIAKFYPSISLEIVKSLLHMNNKEPTGKSGLVLLQKRTKGIGAKIILPTRNKKMFDCEQTNKKGSQTYNRKKIQAEVRKEHKILFSPNSEQLGLEEVSVSA